MLHTRKGLRRPISEKVPVEAVHGQGSVSGWASRVVGYETFDVVLDLDLEGLASELGHKAARNRSGRSIGQSGLIKARIVARKTERNAS